MPLGHSETCASLFDTFKLAVGGLLHGPALVIVILDLDSPGCEFRPRGVFDN